MWLNSYEMSGWAFNYCMYKKDKSEIRKLITDSFWAYSYCMDVNNDPEVRKYIGVK